MSELSLNLRGKALLAFNRTSTPLDRRSSDISINVIGALAAPEPDSDGLALRGVQQAESPLVRTQLLDVIGYMEPELSHVAAMYQLVERRDGIQNNKTFGVTNLVAL